LNTREIWRKSFDKRLVRARIGTALHAGADAPKQHTWPTIFVITFLLHQRQAPSTQPLDRLCSDWPISCSKTVGASWAPR